MTLHELIDILNVKYSGEREKIVAELIDYVRTDSELREQLVGDYVSRLALATVREHSARERDAVLHPKREDVLARQRAADKAFRFRAEAFPLFGGRLLSHATRQEVIESRDRHEAMAHSHSFKVKVHDEILLHWPHEVVNFQDLPLPAKEGIEDAVEKL